MLDAGLENDLTSVRVDLAEELIARKRIASIVQIHESRERIVRTQGLKMPQLGDSIASNRTITVNQVGGFSWAQFKKSCA